MLEPAYIKWGEDWIIPEQEFEKLEANLQDVDLFSVCH